MTPGSNIRCKVVCSELPIAHVGENNYQVAVAFVAPALCGCMLDRNRYLIDHSDILLAVYNGSWRSGTGMTVRHAKKLGREVILIDPKTRSITRTVE